MKNFHQQDFHGQSVWRSDAAESTPQGPNCSLVEFQEEVLAPAGPGIFGHRRLRIISIKQGAARPEGSGREQRPAMKTATAVEPERSLPAPPESYRKILADPGIRVSLAYGKIKNEIASALKDPQRLKESDSIDCYAQIFEAQATLPAAQIAQAELGDPAAENQFHPLTCDKAQMFGAPDLFRQSEYLFELRASSRRIYPGQRVYRLVPVFDPTDAPRPTAGPAERAAPRHRPEPYRFLHSREEVLYDMKAALGTLPPDAGPLQRWFFIYPCRFIKSAALRLFSRPQLKKWRAMREGKTPSDQLWVVTPPRGFTYHPAVRRWAAETLAAAGYEPERNLIEWEIYWRRRGQR